MGTLWRGLVACSAAVWDMSPGQVVTEVRFSAVNEMTPARSEIILQTHHMSASTNLCNDRAAGE